MKKLFTLLVLLVAIVTGAWAEDGSITDKYTTRTLSGNETTSNWAFNVVTGSSVDVKAETVDNEMVLVATSDAKIKMQTSKYVSFNTGTEVYIPVPSGSAGTVSLTMNSSNDSRYFQLYTNGTIGTDGQRLYSKLNAGGITSDGKKGPQSFSFTSNDITTYQGKTYLHFKSEIGEMKVASFTIALTTGTYAKGPQITTQPQGASYMTGQTIAALTVEATPSTATFQWYTCDDADKTNAQPIENATEASYTPTAAGFYYVAVTDGGVTVNSSVAQITVSAATAPTINATGAPAEAVKVGAEVILTAEATGTPTPTITWYDSNNQSVATIEGTQLAYTVPTNEAGTYTFYAKASNGVEPDATSATQTIVVKAQVATPTFSPNGAYFEESQKVTIACADADATIKYSTDGGTTWNDYADALTFTATTTLQAKAVKEGSIDSEVASATFNLITLVEQTSISEATTWDFSKYGTKEIGTNGTQFYRNDVLVANVAQYGKAAAATDFGPATALVLNGDYIVRDSKFCQVTHAKFKTTVPGTLKVVFSNTGSDTRPYRYLYVNGVKTEYASNTSKSNTTAEGIQVNSGEVDLYGVLDPEADNEDAGQVNFIRIYSIEFTPLSAETLILGEQGGNADKITAAAGTNANVFVDRKISNEYYNTLFLPFALTTEQISTIFGVGTKVAKYKGLKSNGTTFLFENVTTDMEANVGYLVKPANTVNGFSVEGATIVKAGNISVTGGSYAMLGTYDTFTNGSSTSGGIGISFGGSSSSSSSNEIYYFTTDGKMKKLSANGKIKGLRAVIAKVPEGKNTINAIANNADLSYGGGSTETGRAREEYFVEFVDDASVVTAIEAIDNSQLTIDNDAPAYNLAGQKVGKGYKGIVIINGKKVVK